MAVRWWARNVQALFFLCTSSLNADVWGYNGSRSTSSTDSRIFSEISPFGFSDDQRSFVSVSSQAADDWRTPVGSILMQEDLSSQALPSGSARLDTCKACYNELTILGELDDRGHFNPADWHSIFVKLMHMQVYKPKLSKDPAPRRSPAWAVTPEQIRLGLPNCDLRAMLAVSGSDARTMNVYNWYDIFEIADADNNFRVTLKELKANGIEPYNCGGSSESTDSGKGAESKGSEDEPVVKHKDSGVKDKEDKPAVEDKPAEKKTSEDTPRVKSTKKVKELTVVEADGKTDDVHMVSLDSLTKKDVQTALSFERGSASLAKPDDLTTVWNEVVQPFLNKYPQGTPDGWKHQICTHVGTTVGVKDLKTGEVDQEESLAMVRDCDSNGGDKHGIFRHIWGKCLIKERSEALKNKIQQLSKETVNIRDEYKSYVYTDRFAAVVAVAYKGSTAPECTRCTCDRPDPNQNCQGEINDNTYIDAEAWSKREQYSSCCLKISCVGDVDLV